MYTSPSPELNVLDRKRQGKRYSLLCFKRMLPVILIALLPAFSFAANTVEETTEAGEPVDFYTEAEERFKAALAESYQDDLFELIDRGVIRVLVTYSKTHFFLDNGAQHGLTYEMLREFESYLKSRYKGRRKGRALSVIAIPVARDEILEKLSNGQADLAIANLTITPERKEVADFSIPVIGSVKEVIVAAPNAPKLNTLDDISGKTFFLRKSSSFYTHLMSKNEELRSKGLEPAVIIEADEHLEIEDLIEMANADLISYTIADDHIAKLWSKIFEDITVYDELSINTGGSIAWAVRKNTPNLIYEVNRFLKRHRSGTLFGNVVKNRYLENPYWAKRALSENEKMRFNDVVDIFRKYSDLYNFDHLMLLAQGYQESQLDHDRKSPVGAIGIMQVMPSTGKAMEVGDIKDIENNVHAGSKYLRKIIDHYFNDPEISETNRVLFAFAAYNAGPTRIQKLRRKTEKYGLDPNVWFGNVEHTVARHVGRETVTYVANISKYFIAYRLIEEQSAVRNAVKESAQGDQ